MTFTELLKVKKEEEDDLKMNAVPTSTGTDTPFLRSPSANNVIFSTNSTATPTFTEALRVNSVNDIERANQNNLTEKQKTPNVNFDSLIVGGLASDVNNNPISVGDPQKPTYTNILNNSGAVKNGTYTDTLNISDTVKNGTSAPEKSGATEPSTPMTFEEWYAATRRRANETYDKTVADAEIERRRAVVDAGNAYDHNRSSYGNNAAALGAMGLTGSGYSQYLDSKAYAQMRGDINAADRTKQMAVSEAQGVRANTEAQADSIYMDYLNQKEANKTNMFNTLYDNAGSLTNKDIDNLAAVNGFTPEQVTALKAGRLERIKASLDSTDYEKKDLDSLFDVSIPEEKALYDTYYSKLADNTSTVNFLDENDKLMSESTVSAELNKVKSALGEDSEAYKTLKAKYDKMYNVTTKGVTYTGKEMFNKLTADNVGDNFEVEVGEGKDRTKYNVQNGGKVESGDADSTVLSFMSSGKVKDGEVFAWNGALYLRSGTDIIRVEQRDVTYAGQYEALKKVFGLK